MSSGTDYNYDEQVSLRVGASTHDTAAQLTARRVNSFPTSSSQSRHWSPFLLQSLSSDRAKVRILARASTPRPPSDTYAELENTGTTIESDFAPEHADLIQGQRKKQKRAERRTKRGVLMLGGWSLNALMMYLIWVTARTVTKIWDPYEVLGVSRVRVPLQPCLVL